MVTRPMPFGKHEGELLEDIPTAYLRWLFGLDNLYPDLRADVAKELDAREGAGGNHRRGRVRPVPGGNGVTPDVEGIMRTWWRQLCLDYYPDRGGDTKVMQALNDAHERLQRLLAG